MYYIQNFSFTQAFGVGTFFLTHFTNGVSEQIYLPQAIQLVNWQSQDLEPGQVILIPGLLLTVVPNLGRFHRRGPFDNVWRQFWLSQERKVLLTLVGGDR